MLSVHFSAATVHWRTPSRIYETLDREFHFDYDPCPLFGAAGTLFDGLRTSWAGRRVYCNPPYGKGMERWFARGLEAAVAVFLVPARTDTIWFHEMALPNAKEIRFLRGRLRFSDGRGRAPFPSMLVIFEKETVH